MANEEPASLLHPHPMYQQPLLREIKDAWLRQPTKSEDKNDKILWNVPLPQDSIYAPAGTPVGKVVKRFNVFHYGIKYKLYVPLLLALERFTNKQLHKTIPETPYNADIQNFNDAWEAAMSDWAFYYMGVQNPGFSKTPAAAMRESERLNKRGYSARLLRSIKSSMITLALNDTAYREFLNMFMHNSLRIMQERHPEKVIMHPLYLNSSITDVAYFAIWQKIKDGELEAAVEHLQGVARENKTVKDTGGPPP